MSKSCKYNMGANLEMARGIMKILNPEETSNDTQEMEENWSP